MVVPPTPSGYGPAQPIERPRWRLEAAGVVVLVVLGGLLGLHRALAGADAGSLAVVLLTVVGLTVAHEGVHFLAATWLGAQPTLRWFPPAVVTLDTWGTRRDDLVTLAAPLVVLDLVAGAGWALAGSSTVGALALIVFVVNTAVSVGDLYAMGYLLRRPRGTRTIVIRTDDGLAEFVAEPARDAP